MTYEAVRSISLAPVTANVINANRFVNLVAGTGTIDESTAAGDCIGVSLDSSAALASAAIPVALPDGCIVEVEAGAAVTIGARLISDATGRGITATGATARVLGRALTAAGAAGDMMSVLFVKDAGEFVA